MVCYNTEQLRYDYYYGLYCVITDYYKGGIMSEFKAILITVSMWVLVLLFCLSSWIVKSKYESQTFNRLTGKQTMWFDALWVQLRVVERISDTEPNTGD